MMTTQTQAGRGASAAMSFRPLLIDVAVPIGGYYLLRDAAGLSLWLSLALSGVLPAVRTAASLLASRRLNGLAALMLTVNVAGIGVSFATGDPRLMIARESVVSSVIAVAILASVATRRPLMSAGLRPFLTRGAPGREAAWQRLAEGSARFRRLELLFSAIWGVVLLADCAVRLAGAFMLAVTTMVWLSTVITLGAIGVAMTASGVAVRPMLTLIEAELTPAETTGRRALAGRKTGRAQCSYAGYDATR